MEAPSHVDKLSLRNHYLRVPFHAYYKKSKKSYVSLDFLDFLDCCIENSPTVMTVGMSVYYTKAGYAEFCPESSGAIDATSFGGFGTSGMGNIPE